MYLRKYKLSKAAFLENTCQQSSLYISENSCSKNFVNFQEKHPHEIAFLNKVVGYLRLTGNVLLENLWSFQNRFHKKHLRMLASAISCWKTIGKTIGKTFINKIYQRVLPKTWSIYNNKDDVYFQNFCFSKWTIASSNTCSLGLYIILESI